MKAGFCHRVLRANVLGFVVAVALLAPGVEAQTVATMSLRDAVRYALAHHPVIEGADAAVSGAEANADAARAAQLPSLTAVAQAARATTRVVPGAIFPITGVPAIAGPTGIDGSYWGSTTGLTASFPITGAFGAADLAASRSALQTKAEARRALTRADIAAAAAAAFLDARAAHALQAVADAAVARADALVRTSAALTAQSLRPEADVARAKAELALAFAEVARARRGREVAEVRLGAALGMEGAVATTDSSAATSGADDATGRRARIAQHPSLLAAEADVASAERLRSAARLGWWPRLDLVGALWHRGSGVPLSAVTSAGSGLAPDLGNWAFGLQLSWPLLGLPGMFAEARAADAALAGRRADAHLAAQSLAVERRVAEVTLVQARALATATADALAAARASLEQSRARFEAGLAPVLELAESQRVMARAEAEDALARIGIRAAEIAVARATGDVNEVLAAVERSAR